MTLFFFFFRKQFFKTSERSLFSGCTEILMPRRNMEIISKKWMYLALSSQCVHSKLCVTLNLIHQTSPRGCSELVRICLCVQTLVRSCVVAVCKVIHWLRQMKYDMQPCIVFRKAQNIHAQRTVCRVFIYFIFAEL